MCETLYTENLMKMLAIWRNKITDNDILFKCGKFYSCIRDMNYFDETRGEAIKTSVDVDISKDLSKIGSIEAYFCEKPVIYTREAFSKFYYFKFCHEFKKCKM